MNYNMSEPTVFVSLPVTFVNELLDLDKTLSRGLASYLQTTLDKCVDSSNGISEHQPDKTVTRPRGKYTAVFLRVSFSENTLPEIFARFVDMTAEVAPEVLDELSHISPRKRRYVSRDPNAIHPGNSQLPTMRTNSGWWISKNIGRRDLIRALSALSKVADLAYGRDIKFQ
ncbi:hypothetical protein [uncultured Roseibium sp.]|uniref:hypothetical protein n=1 Tax=uncultured Roseibium sp. TaxID=1936171 RepID=UPI002633B5AF|nr:hypothetical protein [uncultured Roseibium sp.]